MIDERMEDWWYEKRHGKTEVFGEKPAPRHFVFATDPARTALGLKLGFGDKKPEL
jgi:hypothetical protein